jgi:hypothetical protein
MLLNSQANQIAQSQPEVARALRMRAAYGFATTVCPARRQNRSESSEIGPGTEQQGKLDRPITTATCNPTAYASGLRLTHYFEIG